MARTTEQTMEMVRHRAMTDPGVEGQRAAERFFALAGEHNKTVRALDAQESDEDPKLVRWRQNAINAEHLFTDALFNSEKWERKCRALERKAAGLSSLTYDVDDMVKSLIMRWRGGLYPSNDIPTPRLSKRYRGYKRERIREQQIVAWLEPVSRSTLRRVLERMVNAGMLSIEEGYHDAHFVNTYDFTPEWIEAEFQRLTRRVSREGSEAVSQRMWQTSR